jgi:hypothetical protein
MSEVPILAGVRYTFVPTSQGGFYGAAEAGVSLIWKSASTSSSRGEKSASDSDVTLSGTLAVGYQIGDFDARASLYLIDLDHTSTSALVATVAYTFASL